MATRAAIEIDEEFVTPEPVGEVDDGVESTKPEGDEAEGEQQDEGETRKLSDAEKLKRTRTREKRYRQEAAEANRKATAAAAELAAMRERVAALETATVGQAKGDLQNRVNWLQQQRDAALEAGDTKTFSAFDKELRETDKKLARFEDAEANGRPLVREQQQQTRQAEGQISTAAKDWLAENDWYNDPARREDSLIAQSVARAVQGEGFDPNDEDFWDEVDRRLTKRGIAEKQAAQTRTSGRAGSPQLASGSRGGGSGSGGLLSKIPKAAQEAYRKSGFDLDDPKVVAGIVERHSDRWARRA